MNWTGGRLQRHSHKNHKFLKSIQKQYFAKARLKAQKRLSNGPSTPPAGSLLSWHLHGRVSPQQMRERINSYKGRESRHLICKGQNVSSHHHHSNETIFSPSNSSLDQSHGTQTSRLQNSNLNAPVQYPQLNDPFSLQQHRKLQAEAPEAQSFEDLRRKLLKRKDWVNLSIARPLIISRFLKSDRHVENLAKRRHRGQQRMGDHILNQEADSDADIVAGTMLDSPSNCLDCNGLDMDFSDRPNSNSNVIHANIHGMPTPTRNLGTNGKNISQLKLGPETEMVRAKGFDSQKLYPERSSPTNGFSYEPHRRGSVDVELPIVFETSRRHMFLDHQKHNPSSLRSIPAGPRNCRQCSSAVQCHTREDIFIGHLSDYGSVLGSDSRSQSQDPSESMLLDNEEIYVRPPIETELRNNKQHRPQATSSNGDRGSTLHQGQYGSPPMSDIQSHPSTFNQLDVDLSSSSVGQLGSLNNTEAVDTRKHRVSQVRSPNARKNLNPLQNQTAMPANHPRLPTPDLQMQYYMHPERFPDDSLRYNVPNPYTSSNTSAVSNSDTFDDQSELRIRRDSSFVLNHSTREKSTPASLGSQDFPSSPNRREGTERGSFPKDKHGITGYYQCSPTPPTRLGSKNSAEPEAPAVKPQGNRDLNAARNTYADDYLWKRFIFGSFMGNSSQDTSGYSKLPSPARVEASERAIADGPAAYIRSLPEPNESCHETLSHIEATHPMFVFDSANSNGQGIESDSSGCEVSSQDAVVGITKNRFSHQGNCSEYGDIVNGPLASQAVVDDNENLRM
ncbi:hypothetical protein PAAG_12105 [Paracoccidioides lutzii Pb01]|uniref:Uncharacterized protein n=1 Tax=Paracoccidioides lutzii (strain ATCC MYA-826 / Pb01) TaxID=502779 RepID=A0A0A2V128_PARBA|nr:hypothetical protein PAAG_12105 [Paracoccidioides lutzii Pb01]KGQ01163.1 hypothetical protein PAAG_12105 [Paracoccidioides lutzii Pb01]